MYSSYLNKIRTKIKLINTVDYNKVVYIGIDLHKDVFSVHKHKENKLILLNTLCYLNSLKNVNVMFLDTTDSRCDFIINYENYLSLKSSEIVLLGKLYVHSDSIDIYDVNYNIVNNLSIKEYDVYDVVKQGRITYFKIDDKNNYFIKKSKLVLFEEY